MINLCGSLPNLLISTSRPCVALLKFERPVFFCTKPMVLHRPGYSGISNLILGIPTKFI